MQKTLSPYLISIALCLAAGLATSAAGAKPKPGTLEVTVSYEGPGEVDRDHGLILFVFGDDNFADPTNPILDILYLPENGKEVSLEGLDREEVWLMAVYDEVGGYSGGPLPGPFTLYSLDPMSMSTPVTTDGRKVSIQFDDSMRQPPPAEPKPRASLATLQGAEAGITEIRIYHVVPGRREDFVRFFEDTLALQAKAGLEVRGQFRSLDDENTFVWIRTFRSQTERQEQSRAFYFGPDWLGARNVEAAGLIQSAEVLLLEPTDRSKLR